MPTTRVIGGVTYDAELVRNEVGFDYLLVCTVPDNLLSTLGAPEVTDTFVPVPDGLPHTSPNVAPVTGY